MALSGCPHVLLAGWQGNDAAVQGAGPSQPAVQAAGVPAQDALQEAKAWLTVLVACLDRGALPPAALVLANDLTELLYYSGVPQGSDPAVLAQVCPCHLHSFLEATLLWPGRPSIPK